MTGAPRGGRRTRPSERRPHPEVIPAVPQGRIHLVIDSTFESAQAEQAADHMRSNQAHGKIVPTMP
nr:MULTISPECIES: zinc-binding dehydrogenase [unclassified Actinopolyspora]